MAIPAPRVKMIAADDFAASRAVPYDQRNGLSILNTGTALVMSDVLAEKAWVLSATAGVLASASSSNAAYTSTVLMGIASGDKGAVMAVRGAFTTVPASSGNYPRIGWLSSGDVGLRYTRNGSNGTAFKADWISAIDTGLTGPALGSTFKTAAIRLEPNRALDGYDTISIWFEGTAGDAPDAVSTVPANVTDATLSKLLFSVYNADVPIAFALSHWAIWRPEIANGGDNPVLTDFPDAQMRALATDLPTELLPQPSDLAGNAQLADVAPTGGLADTGPSTLTGAATLADVLIGGTLGMQPGTITTAVWKNAAGDVLPNQAVPLLTFLRRSDGFQALVLQNLATTNSPSAPTLAVTHGNLVPGTWYMVCAWNADGSIYGMEPYLAA